MEYFGIGPQCMYASSAADRAAARISRSGRRRMAAKMCATTSAAAELMIPATASETKRAGGRLGHPASARQRTPLPAVSAACVAWASASKVRRDIYPSSL